MSKKMASHLQRSIFQTSGGIGALETTLKSNESKIESNTQKENNIFTQL